MKCLIRNIWLSFIGIILISCNTGGSQVTAAKTGNQVRQITLIGSYKDMGYQYGSQQKAQILAYYKQDLVPVYDEMEANPSGKKKVDGVINSLKASLPFEFKEFYLGMADGTGLNYDAILKIAYFFNFDFLGSCASLSSLDSKNPQNNYIMHTYDGSQKFFRILKDKITILNLYPNNGDEKTTLITFFGSLASFVGINSERLTLQLDNGLLSAPLKDNDTQQEFSPKPEGPNMLPYLLLKNHNYQDLQATLLGSFNNVAASTIFILSDKLHHAIFYLTPQQTIQQNEADLKSPENNNLIFITNTFLNNPEHQPIAGQQFIYSKDADSPSLTFGRLEHLISFANTFHASPNFDNSYNFINLPYASGGIVMLPSENHPDTTYFRIIFSQASEYMLFNQTIDSVWHKIPVVGQAML